jgi:VWA domain containing CoxE-like protein
VPHPRHPARHPPAPAPSRAPGTAPSPVRRAVASAAAAITAAVAAENAPLPAGPPGQAAQRAAENTARASAASAVFSPGGPPGATVISGTREPREDEKAAARHLARALRGAAARDRVPVTITSATPPGRLKMRAAMAADAQRAAGALPTAQPFSRTARRHVPAPPLRVGIACDISGSMYEYAVPVASAAWILARAAAAVPATTATVLYGHAVTPLTWPGRAPARVTEFTATGSYEKFCDAVDALDGALALSRPGAARLLVIVSDGNYKKTEPADGQKRITRLAAAGCGILWLAPDTPSSPMTGARVITLTDPAATITAIARAATRALAP